MAYRNPNSFVKFQDVIASGAKEPARSNLFGVEIGVPAAMVGKYGEKIVGLESITTRLTI